MTQKKNLLLYGLFYSATVLLLSLMLSGCSKQETVEVDPYPEMSADLKSMQGRWLASDTNNVQECGAIIEGYTIRLRYQSQTNSPMLKHNASIDRLDEARKLIIINGGIAAWPYYYGPEDGIEHLEVEFFSKEGWNRMHMTRREA